MRAGPREKFLQAVIRNFLHVFVLLVGLVPPPQLAFLRRLALHAPARTSHMTMVEDVGVTAVALTHQPWTMNSTAIEMARRSSKRIELLQTSERKTPMTPNVFVRSLLFSCEFLMSGAGKQLWILPVSLDVLQSRRKRRNQNGGPCLNVASSA